MLKYIVFIHQSSELYGSDKTLYSLVKATKERSEYEPLVVLPEEGPLKNMLEANEIEVITMDVLKVSRDMFRVHKIIGIPFRILKLTRALHRRLENKEVHLIHSNTLAVLLGAFYSRFYKVKHLWHVHEIIEKPTVVSNLFSYLIYHFSTLVAYNSKATMDFWCDKKNALRKKSKVVLNGVDRLSPPIDSAEKQNIRHRLFNADEHDLVIGLVGRINLWKGQHLLLESFRRLTQIHNNLKLVFVGSVYKGNEHLLEELKSKIQEYGLENSCLILPFQKNIFSIWDSIDIAVVPSTEPEPFGLVAVEAMLAKKPLVAANHGGLTEIIIDNHTGYFFKPNDVEDLTDKISLLIKNPTTMKSFGDKGYERAVTDFSEQRYEGEFLKIFSDLAI